MRALRRILLVGAAALLCAGCASRLLHRGSEAAATPPRAATSKATKAARTAEREKPQRSAKRSDTKRAAREDKRARSLEAHAAATPADATADLREHMQQQPAEPYWPYRLAEIEGDAGRGGAAEDLLRASIARDSAYAPALTRLSRMLYEQGRHEEAVRLLDPVREQRVEMPREERAAVLSGLALHEAALGMDREAKETMGMLAHDERGEALAVAAYLAVRGGSPDTAARLTAAAVRSEPKSAAAHNNHGIALLRGADPDAAAAEFERAIELDPALPGPYYNLAILERWYRLDPTAATQRFRQYWSRSHADPDSLYAELGRDKPAPVAEEGPSK